MSKWSTVSSSGRLICVYNDSLQELLSLLVDTGSSVETADEDWFRDLLDQSCTQSEVRDLGMTLDENWTSERTQVVVGLLRHVEATGAVADVRNTIVELISGTLQPDPSNGSWYIGVEPGEWLVMPNHS